MRKNSRPVAVVLAAAVALSSVVGGGAAYASSGAAAEQLWESVTVTGQGESFGKPDRLDASFAVEHSSSTVAAALKQTSTAAVRMRDALVKGGVAKADLQTSNVSINATRKDDGAITGYTVNQGLTAKIRDLKQGGALISAAVSAGGDAARLNGTSFAIENDSALLAAARKKAFADAKRKAGLYAREAGRPLGRVVKVSEGGPVQWGQGGSNKFASSDASVPLEPGRQSLTVNVTVEWMLDPAAK